ncbi:MAG: HD-GYP domain-containing protein [Planctomycetota bacterium]
MSDERPPVRDAEAIVTQLIDELVAALVNARIYATSHPRFQGSLSAVITLVKELSAATGENPVRIACTEDLLIHQKRPLLAASLAASRLIDLLRSWGSGGVELSIGLCAAELTELFTAMGQKPAADETWTTLNARLEQRQFHCARLMAPYVDMAVGASGRPDSGSRLHVAVKFYQTLVDLLQNVTIAVCRGGRIEFDPVKSMAEQMLLRLESDEGPLLSLARQDQYDAFTFGHSVRVAVLAMTFAKSLTEDRDLVTRIGVAALLHDVGKALIPFEILHMQRRLTADEFREMSKHPQLGAELLLDHHDSDPLAIAAAFGHHQTKDGRGYPATAHCGTTSVVTEIVKICDVYEALTAARPYKLPMSPVKAYRVMLAMGDKFDRGLLRKFVEINGVFPVGQPVELSTGEVAVVRRQGQDHRTPVVELMVDELGQPLSGADREVVDLSELGCGCVRTILGEASSEITGRLRSHELTGTT